MQLNVRVYIAFFGVLAVHGFALYLTQWMTVEPPNVFTPPVIRGQLIAQQPADVVQIPRPSQPKPVTQPKQIKPQPKPKPKPLTKPKAVSQRTKTLPEPAATPALQPTQQETVEETAEPVEAETQQEYVPRAAPVTPPRTDARQQNNPAPAYPRVSRRRGEQGTVILAILILADGSVDEVRIKSSSGYSRLDQSAIQAVKQWRYEPARRGDRAIDFWYEQPIVFSLRRK